MGSQKESEAELSSALPCLSAEKDFKEGASSSRWRREVSALLGSGPQTEGLGCWGL